jgi:hypothetical protein
MKIRRSRRRGPPMLRVPHHLAVADVMAGLRAACSLRPAAPGPQQAPTRGRHGYRAAQLDRGAARTIAFVRESGADVTVRGGGHSAAASAVAEGAETSDTGP